MALEKFRSEDVDAMKMVEREIVRAVIPFRPRMDPMLVALALTRCARTMLRLCPKNDQKELVPVLKAFLDGRVSPPEGSDGRTESGLVIPPWAM
jgi:hypothetical protein